PVLTRILRRGRAEIEVVRTTWTLEDDRDTTEVRVGCGELHRQRVRQQRARRGGQLGDPERGHGQLVGGPEQPTRPVRWVGVVVVAVCVVGVVGAAPAAAPLAGALFVGDPHPTAVVRVGRGGAGGGGVACRPPLLVDATPRGGGGGGVKHDRARAGHEPP